MGNTEDTLQKQCVEKGGKSLGALKKHVSVSKCKHTPTIKVHNKGKNEHLIYCIL